MKTVLWKATAFGGMTLAAATAFAQNEAGRGYLSADVGPAFVQDVGVRNLGTKLSFDAGARADIAAGINWTDFLATEIQTGAIANHLDQDNSVALSVTGNRTYLSQVPLLANVILKAPLAHGITPYIGAGAGGMESDLSIRRKGHWTDDSDLTFAYQGLAGVKVAITRHIQVGGEYRFLGSSQHTFFGDDASLYTPIGKTLTHSILATFTWSF